MTAHICYSYGTVCLKRVNFTVYKHTLINLALKKEKRRRNEDPVKTRGETRPGVWVLVGRERA